MPRKPAFTIDLRVRTAPISRKRGSRLCGLLGVYFYESNDAYVFLAPLRKWVEKYAGQTPSEDLFIKAISDTACHETLHSLVRSSGPNYAVREHRAISRLMAAADLDWRYLVGLTFRVV